uniref:Uncharacterized protein n=1 Tax=Aegilops tauschii subsp. strangulata TaxID=200361 RepID=A0A453SJV4_AEGTS
MDALPWRATLLCSLAWLVGHGRDALLVPEVVGGINGGLHLGELLVVAEEVALAPEPGVLGGAEVVLQRVLPDVQVPEVDVRLPRVLRHVVRHEPVEPVQPARRRRPAVGAHPVRDVLDHVQHPAPVRVRGGVLGHAAHEPAVRLQHDHPGALHREPAGVDLLPHRLGDGAPDVVGLALAEGGRAGGSRQEHVLHRLAVGEAEEGQRRRLQPRHGLAVGARHVQLREAVAHRRGERAALAEVQRPEHGLLPRHHHRDRELAGERRRHVLPFREDVDGALLQRLGDVEHCHRGRDWHQLHLPREHHAEVAAAAAADGPEQVLPHAGPVEEIPVGVHQLGVHHPVDGEPVLAHHHANPSTAEVAAHADGGALAGREREAGVVLGDGVVELPDGGAGLDPRRGRRLVDADGPERREVEQAEHLLPRRPVRQALVVVPAAAHAEAHAVAAAAPDGGLHVRRVGGRDDAQRLGRGVDELGVLDVVDQHAGEAAGALRVHQLAGDLVPHALEEVVGGGHGRNCGEEEAREERERQASASERSHFLLLLLWLLRK